MKRTSILTIVGVLMVALVALLCSGCGKEQGAEFIGTWKKATPYYEYQSYATIKKGNDKSYIVDIIVINTKNPKASKVAKTYPAVYNNGKLQITGVGELFLDGDTLQSTNKIITNAKKISDKILTLNELNK